MSDLIEKVNLARRLAKAVLRITAVAMTDPEGSVRQILDLKKRNPDREKPIEDAYRRYLVELGITTVAVPA